VFSYLLSGADDARTGRFKDCRPSDGLRSPKSRPARRQEPVFGFPARLVVAVGGVFDGRARAGGAIASRSLSLWGLGGRLCWLGPGARGAGAGGKYDIDRGGGVRCSSGSGPGRKLGATFAIERRSDFYSSSWKCPAVPISNSVTPRQFGVTVGVSGNTARSSSSSSY